MVSHQWSHLRCHPRILDRPRLAGPRARRNARPRQRFAPALLPLEARALLSTLTVTNDADSGKGSLRYELGVAHSGDTIRFAPSADGTIKLTSGPLQVPNGVDVQGPGPGKVTVSGDDQFTVFDIGEGVTASISGLTITDGRASVVDNYGFVSGGGGIYSLGNLTITNCVVTGNSAPAQDYEGGGGIFSSAIPYVHHTLTIDDCTISGNSAYEGGGIETGGPLTITDSTVSGNSGGGILDYGSNASLTDSVLADNTGGGIAINGIGITPVPTLTVTDSTIEGNSGAVFGGGIGSINANVTVSGSLIADNTSTNYPGGGLALGGGIDMSGNLSADTPGANILTITGTTFVGNEASSNGTSGGGAIYADSYSTISVKDSSFTDNIASADAESQGGALDFNTLEQGAFTDCTFTGNQAVHANAPGYAGNATGGAIANAAGFGPQSPLTITGSTFTDNLAQAGVALGGAILNQSRGATLDLVSCVVAGNRAVGGGATASAPTRASPPAAA